jgi:hypothetical protein
LLQLVCLLSLAVSVMISRSRQQKCRMQTERRVRSNQQGLSQDVREAERPRWLGRCSDADGPPLLKGGGEGEVSRVYGGHCWGPD